MTDSIEYDLAKAGLDKLAADAVITVHDGRVPDGASPPYVLVYATVAWPAAAAANTIIGTSLTASATWYCHCVAGSATGVRVLQQRCRTALLNQSLIVAGRSVGQIKLDEVLAPIRDETLGHLVMDGVSVFSVICTP